MLLCSTVNGLGEGGIIAVDGDRDDEFDDVHRSCYQGPRGSVCLFSRILTEDFRRRRRRRREGEGEIPTLHPATCVLSFRVECCCLLALQERERVGGRGGEEKKKYCGGVYPSYVHYFSATYVLYTKKNGKKV